MTSGGVITIVYQKWEFKPPTQIDANGFAALKRLLSANPEMDLAPSTAKQFLRSMPFELSMFSLAIIISIIEHYTDSLIEGTGGWIFGIIAFIGYALSVRLLLSFLSFLSYRASLKNYYRILKNDIIECQSFEAFHETFYPKVLYGQFIKML